MLRASLSILGLYRVNPDLFLEMQLPEDEFDSTGKQTAVAVDKQLLIDNLLAELADLEVVYPDAEFMQQFIGRWSLSRLDTWKKLNRTLLLEWNPIHNYDRTEEWKDVDDGKTVGGSHSDGTSKVAAYNAGELRDNASAHNEGGSETKVDRTTTHTAHMYGNIGITSSDKLLAQYRETVQYNIYDKIIDDFRYRFCLEVY